MSSADRREAILAAARTVFLESGYAGSRTRQISEKAGVSEKLLYQHFRSKEELFEAAMTEPLQRKIDELLAHAPVAAALTDAPSARRESVTAVMDTLLRAAEEVVPLLGALFFADPERGDHVWRRQVLPAMDVFTTSVEQVNGAWRHPDVNAHVVVLSAVGACVALALESRARGSLPMSRERLVRELADNVLYGINARP